MLEVIVLVVVIGQTGSPSNSYEVEGGHVYDGDTITGTTIHLGFGVSLTGQSIRLAGFDAPEITRTRRTVKISDEEILKGYQAKESLGHLIKAAERIILIPEGDGRGAYNRIEGRLYVVPKRHYSDIPRIDVAETMIRLGHDRSLLNNGEDRENARLPTTD